MRLAIYGAVSTTLACWVVFSAFTQRVNYYAACVHLAKSNVCMMILLNMGLYIAIIIGKAMQAIFFGPLRAIEVEHLYERSWYAISETCLAMTIFRDEFNLHFVVLFTTLLFLKIFHWLCQDRVEFMEQAPAHRLTFHLRMLHLMSVLFIVDYYLASTGILSIWEHGPSMMIMFGFEYTIMFLTLLSIIGKYILNVIDWQSEEPWEGKSMYVFYIDLVVDFLKLVTYVTFFVIICIYYQLPLHIVRDVYVTFRSFIQKCRDLYRYRRATRNMDQLYPNATVEDLSGTNDSTCIICREDMHANPPDITSSPPQQPPQQDGPHHNYDQPKKLPCGHIFHFHCLRSWLERQQTCPTCRRSVLADQPATTPLPNDTPPPPPVVNPMEQLPQAMPPQQPPHAFQQPWPQQEHVHSPAQPTTASTATSALPTPTSQQVSPSPLHHGAPPHIPGLIPLAPLDMRDVLPNAHLATQPVAIGQPPTLTHLQLTALAHETREAMEERLRVLDTVQQHIFDTMQYLTQALSMLPADHPPQSPEDPLGDKSERPHSQPSPQDELSHDETDSPYDIASDLLPLSSSSSSLLPNNTQQTSQPPQQSSEIQQDAAQSSYSLRSRKDKGKAQSLDDNDREIL